VQLKTYDRNTELVLHAAALDEVKQRLRDRYPYPERFALKDVHDLLESTRKYVRSWSISTRQASRSGAATCGSYGRPERSEAQSDSTAAARTRRDDNCG